MLDKLKKLFGISLPIDYATLVKQGAMIINVRTAGEFKAGHITHAINIPVDQLHTGIKKLKDKNKPIITCCASGMRSAAAKRVLISNGFTQVFNGGNWMRLQHKIS